MSEREGERGSEVPSDLERLAGALADAKPLPWDDDRTDAIAARNGALAGMQELAQLADGFRRVQRVATGPAAPRPAPLFRFGALEVVARLGEGSQGEVFRAYDPMLDHYVALKLRKADSAGLGTPFLQEARRLARLRHPHVLAVYGAAIEDGRLGLWTELVQGESLHDVLKEHGPLPADEVRQIGQDLCSALAALHSRGLVHGDVKPGNVMRDHSGRIVLMDLGASQDLSAAPADASVSGTLPYLAPEMLNGGTPSPATDLYALGVLLYRIASARYPYAATDFEGLLKAQERGERIPLAQARIGLDPTFVRAIDRALTLDPRKRHPNAAAFGRALAPKPARNWWARGAMMAAIAAALGLALYASVGERLRAPASALAGMEARFERERGEQWEALAPGASLAVGDRLGLTLQGAASQYAYVFDADERAEVSVLYPLPALDLQNPLPPQRSLTLPGTIAHQPFAWQVSSEAGAEEFVVIVATAKLAPIERRLGAWLHPREAPAAIPRGVDVLAPSRASTEIQAAELQSLLAELDADPASRGQYRVWHFRYAHGGSR